MSTIPVVLVTGATGNQGGGVARELLARHKFKVRVFVRNPESDVAKELSDLGAELAVGTLENVASIEKALVGVYGVFSVQPHYGNALELAHNLIGASKRAGVKVFVQASVAYTELHTSLPGWDKGEINKDYWLIKHNTEVAVKEANFPNFTILRPNAFYENIMQPRQAYAYPELSKGIMKSPLPKDFPAQWQSAKDMGVWVHSVLENPSKFNGKSLGLGANVSQGEMANILSEELGRDIKYEEHPSSELVTLGYYVEHLKGCDLMVQMGGHEENEKELQQYNVPFEGFRSFVRAHKDKL